MSPSLVPAKYQQYHTAPNKHPRVMDRMLVAFAALMCIIPVALSQQVFRWKVQDYPDPFSYDTYSECGRNNKSNVCDPNHMISKQKANEIDSLIWSVFRETRCQCSSCVRNSHGYVIRVAIMPRMESILKLGNSTEDKLRDAQMFAYMLTQKWAMSGSCNESLIILYSRYDGVLYTLTLPHARKTLKDEHVKRITMSVRPMFDDDATIGDGLLEMIQRYKLVFDGNKDEALRPRMSKQRGNSASDVSPFFILSLLLTAVVMAILH